METATTPPADSAPAAPSTPRTHRYAMVAMVLFGLYVAAIYVLALDQNFHWGFFPTTTEKRIDVLVQQLGDASLSKEKHDLVLLDLINWNTFSVPPLLNAIEKGPASVRDPAVKCLQTIAFKYYNVDISKFGSDPAKLRQWWNDLQAQWAKAEADQKP